MSMVILGVRACSFVSKTLKCFLVLILAVHVLINFFHHHTQNKLPSYNREELCYRNHLLVNPVSETPIRLPSDESNDIGKSSQNAHNEDVYQEVSCPQSSVKKQIQTERFVVFDDNRSPATFFDVVILPPKL